MLSRIPKLYLSIEDFNKLSSLVASLRADNGAALEDELSRAVVLPDAEVPDDVVSMDSAVRVRDLATGKTHEYRVVFPHEANASAGRISVLAPLGVALIGLKTGDEYEFLAPNGRKRKFAVLSIFSSKARKVREGCPA